MSIDFMINKKFYFLMAIGIILVTLGFAIAQQNAPLTGKATGPVGSGLQSNLDCQASCSYDTQCTGPNGYNGYSKTCEEKTDGPGTCAVICPSGYEYVDKTTPQGLCNCKKSTSPQPNPNPNPTPYNLAKDPCPENSCTPNLPGSPLRFAKSSTSGKCQECLPYKLDPTNPNSATCLKFQDSTDPLCDGRCYDPDKSPLTPGLAKNAVKEVTDSCPKPGGPIIYEATCDAYGPTSEPQTCPINTVCNPNPPQSESSTSSSPGKLPFIVAAYCAAMLGATDTTCGNGKVESGEECDLGKGNSDSSWCTSNCKVNFPNNKIPSYCETTNDWPKGIIFYPACAEYRNRFKYNPNKDEGTDCTYPDGSGKLVHRSDGADCYYFDQGGHDQKKPYDDYNSLWGICINGVCTQNQDYLEKNMGKTCNCGCNNKDGKPAKMNEVCPGKGVCGKKDGEFSKMGDVCELKTNLKCENDKKSNEDGYFGLSPIEAKAKCEENPKKFGYTQGGKWAGILYIYCYCTDKDTTKYNGL